MGPDRWRFVCCPSDLRRWFTIKVCDHRVLLEEEEEEEEEEKKKSNENPKVSTEVLKVDSFIFDSTKVFYFSVLFPLPPLLLPPGGGGARRGGRQVGDVIVVS